MQCIGAVVPRICRCLSCLNFELLIEMGVELECGWIEEAKSESSVSMIKLEIGVRVDNEALSQGFEAP